jgi:acetolactate decarboxylase
MPALHVVIPPSLDVALRDAASARGTSTDSLVSSALSEYFESQRHRMYQISTATTLVEGIYQGGISSKELLKHGDFGLGTFEGLDGEMVVVDSAIYQARPDGTVQRRDEDFRVPFAVVTHFWEDSAFETGEIRSLRELESMCDHHRESDNLFYALRLNGQFEAIHVRVMRPAPPGTRLVDAVKAQPEFHFSNIEGTLVCIWSPRYASSFNVPGYHFHFLSHDHSKGGHALDCNAKDLRAGIQMLCEYDVRLPSKGPFLTADLTQDPASDLAKTE